MADTLKTFTISEMLPCWVNFRYRIQAANKEEAVEAFYNSQADYTGHKVGETIGWLDHSGLEIEEAL